jgi:hypothetical protein
MTLDPKSAALYALVAICLVLVGALLTPGTVGVDERGVVLAGIVTVLLLIGYGFRIRRGGGGDGGE